MANAIPKMCDAGLGVDADRLELDRATSDALKQSRSGSD
jgi:hypothetical protein